jgi:hypothetical protein
VYLVLRFFYIKLKGYILVVLGNESSDRMKAGMTFTIGGEIISLLVKYIHTVKKGLFHGCEL